MEDYISTPKHYQDSEAPCECITAINFIIKDLHGDIAYSVGNVVKYLWRLGKKEYGYPEELGNNKNAQILLDLKKAEWYLSEAIRCIAKKGDVNARH